MSKNGPIFIPSQPAKPLSDNRFERFKGRKKGQHRPLTKYEIELANAGAADMAAACAILGVGKATYRKYCKLYQITPVRGKSGRPKGSKVSSGFKQTPLNEVLDGRRSFSKPNTLRLRLLATEAIPCRCAVCGFAERRESDGKTPLILYFKDGNKKNQHRNNLQFLCYNHAYVYTGWDKVPEVDESEPPIQTEILDGDIDFDSIDLTDLQQDIRDNILATYHPPA